MRKDDERAQVAIAVRACMEKKAQDITILRLDAAASGFTDYFVICSGATQRQVEAIAEGVDEKLSMAGYEPRGVEGRRQAEWVLLDYVDFVVHLFSESARKFYDLERLWKTATRVELADLEKPEPRKVTVKRTVRTKTAAAAHSQKKAKGGARTSQRARKS